MARESITFSLAVDGRAAVQGLAEVQASAGEVISEIGEAKEATQEFAKQSEQVADKTDDLTSALKNQEEHYDELKRAATNTGKSFEKIKEGAETLTASIREVAVKAGLQVQEIEKTSSATADNTKEIKKNTEEIEKRTKVHAGEKEIVKAHQAAIRGEFAQSAKFMRQAFEKQEQVYDRQIQKLKEHRSELQKTTSEVGGLTKLLVAKFSVDTLSSASSDFARLKQELKLIAEEGQDTSGTLQNLFALANSSRQPIDAAVSAFSTLKKSTGELNLSEQQLIKITDTVTKSIAIGGSNAQQASNSMIQFSQALALGKLSGQNFNSVAEQTPGLVQAIAAGLGMTTAQIKVFANDGHLTTAMIIQALQNAAAETDATFEKLSFTIDGALTQLKNNFVNFIGSNDVFSEKIAAGIALIAGNMDLLAAGIATAILAVIGYKAQNLYATLMQQAVATKTLTLANFNLKNIALGVLQAFTWTNIKIAASTTLHKALTLSITACGIAWKGFVSIVKSTGLGLVISGILYVVGKLVEKVYELYESWKTSNKEAVKLIDYTKSIEVNTKNLNTQLEAEKQKREELIAKRNREIEQYEELKQTSGIAAGAIADHHYQVINAINQEINARDKLINRISTQLSLINDDRKTNITLNPARNYAAQTDAVKNLGIAIDTTSKKGKAAAAHASKGTKEAKKEVDHFAQAVNQLSEQIDTANASYERLLAGKSEQLSKLEEVNLKIKQGAQGYANLTDEQLTKIKGLARQYDALIEKTSQFRDVAKIKEDLTAQIEKQRLMNSLYGEKADVIERTLLLYEREQQLQEAIRGKTAEQIATVTSLYQQKWAEEDLATQRQIAEQERSQTMLAVFKTSLQEQIPTLQSVGQTAAQAFGTIADGIADAALGAKVDFRSMAQEILRNIAKMIIKMAVLQGAIMLGNSLTGGALGATLKMLGSTISSFDNVKSAGDALSLLKGIVGFSSGGYTGNGKVNAPAGIVHGQEYVVNAQATRKYGTGMLDAINSGDFVPAQAGAGTVNVIVNNNAPVQVRTQQIPEGLLLTIEEIATQTSMKVYQQIGGR